MDTTRPISYRSVDFNDGVVNADGVIVGSIVQRIDYSSVTAVGYSEKRAQGDGRMASDVYLDGRAIGIDGVLHAASRGDLFDRMQQLSATFSPTSAYASEPGDKGFLPLSFYFPTDRLAEWPSGEIECFIKARPIALPRFVIDRDRSGGDDNSPIAIPWSVNMLAKDPLIYVSPMKFEYVGAIGTDSVTFLNRGSYPSPVNAILIVPAESGETTVSIVGGGSDMTLVIPNDPLSRTVRVSATDHVVTSQLAGGTETLALSMLTQAASTSWPSVPGGLSLDFDVTSDTTLTEGSRLWMYESLV